MEERVCRMPAKDGIQFAKFVTSNDIRDLFKSEGHDLPSSATSIQIIVMAYGASIQKKIIDELDVLKESQKRFAATFDEWSSVRNRRYLNLNLHTSVDKTQKLWNLGLVRIKGSFPAEACVAALKQRLQEFNVDIDHHIISITTDGASVMKKVGRLLPAHHQLCLAHGLQLGVLDVLYKSSCQESNLNENYLQRNVAMNILDDTSDSDDENCNEQSAFTIEDDIQNTDLLPKYRDLIQKVRKVVKLFSSKSPMRNGLLQNYIKADFGKKQQLILDCRTRWSSLSAMTERFNKVKQCIFKALIDLKLTSSYSFTDEDCSTLVDIERALEPVKLAVNVLCREDATLATAETTLRFMINKLEKQNTILSQELAISLSRRVKERRTTMTSVLLYLENPKEYLQQLSFCAGEGDTFYYPKKAILQEEIKLLIQRLALQSQKQPEAEIQIIDNEDEDEDVPLQQLMANRAPTPTLEVQLEHSLQTEWASEASEAFMSTPADSIDLILKRELSLFESSGNRGKHLEAAYDYAKSIPPTSIEAELAFSAAGYMCTKIRSNLKDETLNMLSLLRKYYQKSLPR